MLKATLKNRQQFKNAQGSKYRVNSNSIIMQAAPNNNQTNRIGYIVSKKCGNAVNRNRIKRRLKHAAYNAMPTHQNNNTQYINSNNKLKQHKLKQHELKQHELKQDFIIIAKNIARTQNFIQLSNEIKNAMLKLQQQHQHQHNNTIS